jgi:hypothetical protein
MIQAQAYYHDGHCGITLLQKYDKQYSYLLSGYHKDIKKDALNWATKNGAGWLQASFVVDKYDTDKTKLNKEVYDILKSRYPIVFESEKRMNENSGNLFWFCIYDTSKPLKETK